MAENAILVVLCQICALKISAAESWINKIQETIIRKRAFATPPKQDGPRINDDIRVPKVRLIDETGDNRGEVDTAMAMAMAQEAGLDLVEISPNANPPVCKLLDYGKYKYEQQKKANAARKNQKTQDVKEIKMRPVIDMHDYNVKLKKIHEFIGKGDKVKVTIRFKGREMAHQNLGMDVLNRVVEEMEETVKIEARPKMEGRQMIMVMAPK